jgi:hypothetical protein
MLWQSDSFSMSCGSDSVSASVTLRKASIGIPSCWEGPESAEFDFIGFNDSTEVFFAGLAASMFAAFVAGT